MAPNPFRISSFWLPRNRNLSIRNSGLHLIDHKQKTRKGAFWRIVRASYTCPSELSSMSGNIQVDAVVEARTDLGESPVWDERTQRLYFTDINSQKIHIWDNKSKSHDVIDMPELVGTIIPAPNEDQLVVALTRYLSRKCF